MSGRGFLRGAGIVAFSVAAAIAYGVCHDMVTAHICVEYFTIGHPKIIESESPVAMALLWGVLATWWFGLGLGVPLAIVSRVGTRPAFTVRDLVAPVGLLLVGIAVTSIVFGLLGWVSADTLSYLDGTAVLKRVPPERHTPFLIDRTAHQGAYGAGAIGAIALWIWVWGARARRARGLPREPE